MKGADDFNYYDDTKERVLPGVKAPPPKRERPKIADTMRLADEWQEATKPVRDLSRSARLDDHRRWRQKPDNMAPGLKPCSSRFQKILDPISVVRESEYAQKRVRARSLVEHGQGRALTNPSKRRQPASLTNASTAAPV